MVLRLVNVHERPVSTFSTAVHPREASSMYGLLKDLGDPGLSLGMSTLMKALEGRGTLLLIVN